MTETTGGIGWGPAQVSTRCQLVYDGTGELQLVSIRVREINGGLHRITDLTFEAGEWENVDFVDYLGPMKG
jgi:hypothetical protein